MDKLIVKTEHDKLIELMIWLLGLNEEERVAVTKLVKENGVRDFFIKLESFELSEHVLSKLKDLRNIIQVFDGEIEDEDFDE